MTPFWPIADTALAAALGTLGVELDPAQPYSHVIDTDSGRAQTNFWFRDCSAEDPADGTRRTENVLGYWNDRARFERDPEMRSHPLHAMRAAHDARGEIIRLIHGLDLPAPGLHDGERFLTPHLLEAALLRAHKFPLLLFTGRAFAFPAVWNGTSAAEIIERSQRAEGRSPAQWMARFLVNFAHLIAFAKSAAKSPTARTQDGSRTLLLGVHTPAKLADTFHRQFRDG